MFCHCTVGSVAQSVKRIDTNWTVLGSNPDVAEIFRTRPDRPWGPTSNLYNGYRGNPSDTAAGAWRWPPTPSIPEATERVQLYLPPPGLSWPVLRWTSTFTFVIVPAADLMPFRFQFLQHECYRTHFFITASSEFTCFSGFVCFFGPNLHND